MSKATGDWTDTKDRFPESGQIVMLRWENSHGTKITSVGMYVDEYKIEQSDDSDFIDFAPDGIGYLPQGWYEKGHENDEIAWWYINGTVTHFATITKPE